MNFWKVSYKTANLKVQQIEPAGQIRVGGKGLVNLYEGSHNDHVDLQQSVAAENAWKALPRLAR